MNDNSTTAQAETTDPMTPVKGLLVLLGIIIVVGGLSRSILRSVYTSSGQVFVPALLGGHRTVRPGQAGGLCGGRHCQAY